MKKFLTTLFNFEAQLRHAWSKEARNDPLNRGTIVSLFIMLFLMLCMLLMEG